MTPELSIDQQFGERLGKGVHRYLPDGVNPSDYAVVRELIGERLETYKDVDLLREAFTDLTTNYGLQTINFIPVGIYPDDMPFEERGKSKPERLFVFSEYVEGLSYFEMAQLVNEGSQAASQTIADLTSTIYEYYENKLRNGGVMLADIRLFQFIFKPVQNEIGEVTSFLPVFIDVDPFVRRKEIGNLHHVTDSLEEMSRFTRELSQLVYANLFRKSDQIIDELDALLRGFDKLTTNPEWYRQKRLVPA